MSLGLLLPSALFALFALALPLLIHLQRRRETPPPRLFAAIAYIDPQSRPRQRVRLRDLLLLLLRLLLLATLAFVLAQPLLNRRAGAPWVLLWPGLEVTQAGAVDENAELRWLAPAFPRVDAAAPPALEPPFSLLRQLAFERPLRQAIEVRVPREIDGWDGAALQLGRAIGWTVLPVDLPAASLDAKPLRVAVHAAPAGLDEDQRRALAALRTYFEGMGEASPLRIVDAGDAPAAEGVDALWVLVSDGVAAQAAGRQIEHAAADVGKSGAQVGQGIDDRGEGAAPVGQGPPFAPAQAALESLPSGWRAWLRRGGRVLVNAPGGSAPPESGSDDKANATGLAALDARARMLWRGEHAQLTRHRFEGSELRLLDCGLKTHCLPELLEPDFPRLLQGWLAPAQAPASRIDARAIAPSAEGIAPQPGGTPLREASIAALLLLLLAERWLAATRRPA